MEILLYNVQWMFVNVLLAVIPVVIGALMLKVKNKILKLFLFATWLFYLPNTIYLLTDPVNFFKDALILAIPYLILDAFLYAGLLVIGVVTYVVCVYQFEILLGKKMKLRKKLYLIFVLNILVGIGLVLGRFHRVNSWEVVTNFQNVVIQTLETFTSLYWMGWVIVFAITCQLVYLYFGSFARDRHKHIAA